MKTKKLIIALLLPQFAGALGALFTTPNIPTWYAGLTKPPLNPPNWVFGPVWTTLYLLMGVAFYLILISKNSKKKQHAINLFIGQLILNSLWSIAFFGLTSPLAGLVIILPLAFLIYKNIHAFKQISPTASYLLYPYLLWVVFATYLNFGIFLLNP